MSYIDGNSTAPTISLRGINDKLCQEDPLGKNAFFKINSLTELEIAMQTSRLLCF